MKLLFGKYKGRDIRSVPKDYLVYLLGWDALDDRVRDGIRETMAGWDSKKKPKTMAVVTDIVDDCATEKQACGLIGKRKMELLRMAVEEYANGLSDGGEVASRVLEIVDCDETEKGEWPG